MIILRSEQFGGIVFNIDNAAQLFLDRKGFKLVEKFFSVGGKKFSSEEKKFIDKVLKTIEAAPPLKIKTIKNREIQDNKHPFEVLNSPTLADIQITARCNLHCPHCYANSSYLGKNIAWEDLILALENFSRVGVFQIALGGGEPTLHPQFMEIIKAVKEKGMIPNLTTNGKELNGEVAKAMAKYCGAIALSVEEIKDGFEKRRNFPWKKFCRSAEMLKEYGNKLVFQITASESNMEKLPEIIDCLLRFEPYGIILLAYKPVGRGEFFDRTLANKDEASIKNILKICMTKVEGKSKIGFDCCLTQGIIEMAETLSPFNFENIEGCSALRNSLAVTKNLDVVPCSFINYTVGNLKRKSIESVWHGAPSEKFRNKFYGNIKKIACKNCSFKYQCLGGCPEFKLIKCSKIPDNYQK